MDRLTQLQDAIDAVKIYACCITFSLVTIIDGTYVYKQYLLCS